MSEAEPTPETQGNSLGQIDPPAGERASSPPDGHGPRLRLILVEASSDATGSMLWALERGGIDPVWERVETADGLRIAMTAGRWDAVLSHNALPELGAIEALAIVRASDGEIPFVVVSGVAEADAAVEMMRAGVTDYVLKHNLVRLAPTVEREVREAQARRAKRAAWRAAERLAAVVQSSDDAIVTQTLEGVITSWNPAAEQLYGWAAAEAVGKDTSFIIPPDKGAELSGIMARLRTGERVGYFETVRLHRDGRRIDVALTVSRVRDAEGRLVGVSKTGRDIRERKQAEESLRLSEERSRGLLESIPAMVWVYDAVGRPLLHNHHWYDYTGQTPEDVVAGRWHEAIHPDDAAGAVAAWDHCTSTGNPYAAEYRLRGVDGGYRWFLSQGEAVRGAGEIERWVGTCTDIDERKRAAEALTFSETRYRRLFEAAQDGVLIVDPLSRRVVDVNPFLTNLLGYREDEVVGKELWEIGLFRDIESNKATFRTLQAAGYVRYEDHPLVTKDGREVEVEFVSNTYDVGGTRVIQCNIRDISERKRAERSVRSSEERYRTLIAATTAIVWDSPPSGAFDSDQPGWTAFTGQTVDQHRGWGWLDALHPDDRAESAQAWTAALNDRAVYYVEHRVRRADGEYRHMSVRAVPILDPGGSLREWVGVHTDVTERKRAEQRLTTQHAVVSILAQAPDLREATPRLLRAVCETTGWDVGELWVVDRPADALSFVDLWHVPGLDLAEFRDASLSGGFGPGAGLPGRVWSTGKSAWIADIARDPGFLRASAGGRVGLRCGFGFPIRTGSEVIGVAEFFSRESRTPDPELLRMFDSLGIQIGQFVERKRGEGALRLFRALIDHATDGIEVIDPETGRFLDVNEAACAEHGYTREEYLGLSVGDIDPLVAVRTWREVITGIRHAGFPTIESLHRRKDGSTFPVEVNLNAIRVDRDYIVAVVRDITDRKRAEAERAELFERLNLQIERMPLAYLLTDADWRYTGWNPAAERTFGFSQAEVLGKNPFDVVVPPQSRLAVEAIFARLRAGDMDSHGVCENLTKDGRTITCEWYNTPLFGPDGTFQGVLSLAQDITARKQAEHALLLRDRAIRAVVGGIVITDADVPDNPISYVSPGFERMTGYTGFDVMGQNCRFFQGKDTDPAVVTQLREAVREGAACDVELLNYRKDGTPFWNALSISPVRDAAGRLTHFIGVQTDVTDRRKLEEQFRQVQKMEAVGQLAAGVAHDFNNLLTVINGYSDLMLDGLPSDDPSRELVAEIRKAGERSAGLTRQLLAFSRQQVLAPRVLDLNAVVADTEKMLRRLIGEDVELATAPAPGLWAVRADPGQVEQVLMNLCVNARDAMPTGGRLTIETRNVRLDEAYARTHPDARPGPHALLSVTDTGCGMAPEVKARIFEPFFTTKGPGKGTGLGLATAYGIVRQSGGHVAAYSEVGVGTSFKVYLPRAEGEAVGATSPSGLRRPPRGTETILLAEDEDGVRTLTRRVLAGCGYTVVEASDGDEAVLAAAAHPGPIHLLVTDVVMPGSGGRAVSERVGVLHPGARVLFLSGYTDDAVIRHGVLREGVNFLQKPFSPHALAAKVREVLDAAGKSG